MTSKGRALAACLCLVALLAAVIAPAAGHLAVLPAAPTPPALASVHCPSVDVAAVPPGVLLQGLVPARAPPLA